MSFVVINRPTYATALMETAAAAGSYTVAKAAVVGGAGVATAAVARDSNAGIFGGIALGLGGVVLGAIDPPSGTFYNGTFSITYPSQLFQVNASGWLGQWGADTSLPNLPVDPNQWGDRFVVTLQNPNPSSRRRAAANLGLTVGFIPRLHHATCAVSFRLAISSAFRLWRPTNV